MELLAQLKNEDDNPRGQQQGRFVSGATLEEAAAAETRRAEIKAAKLPLPRQEAGIIHLMQARNFFARLKLPEPTWDADGAPVWDCSEETMARAYAEAMKCCHPEWSHHPKRDTGFALLTEAHDVLTNRTGKRDAYLRASPHIPDSTPKSHSFRARFDCAIGPDRVGNPVISVQTSPREGSRHRLFQRKKRSISLCCGAGKRA